MSAFDLLFLALVLAGVAGLLAAGWFALRGQSGRSLRILAVLLAGGAIYIAIVILVSALLPRRVLAPGAAECFDDWCISVARVSKTPQSGVVAYDVDLRLSSRARRAVQRENNLTVYLTSDGERRYDSVADAAAMPFDVLLGPGESVTARRRFLVPAGVRVAGMVAAHEGGFPIGWFIIGYDTWFRKPTVIRLSD